MAQNEESPSLLPKGTSHSPEQPSRNISISTEVERAYESLKRIRQASLRDKNLIFTSLHHHLSIGMLALSFFKLNKYAVPGIDKMSKEEYQRNLTNNLINLRLRIINNKHRFTEVKRVYISKQDGSKRPLGICIIEDKIIQGALKLILEAIYDPLFVGVSYGFRPETRAHDALDALYMAIDKHPVNYILDADIEKCFDNINHDVLLKILSNKIGDKKILRLITKMIKAGVLEELTIYKTTKGVIQGSVISPLLANIYLDEVIDKFFINWRNQLDNSGKFSCIVRYADNFIIGFQELKQANEFLRYFEQQLFCADLKLHKKKTRLIEFGRNARNNRRKNNEPPPETFQFLWFTHICSISKKYKTFKLLRYTATERICKKITEQNRMLRNLILGGVELKLVIRRINRFLIGYYNYFAVHDNTNKLDSLRYVISKTIFKLINRRSQYGYTNWKEFNKSIGSEIVSPKVKHCYPRLRFASRQKHLSKIRNTTFLYEPLNSLVET